ncbi:hypothetical protein NPIL_536061 [Nephila pilipes]|uniref:Uncharacterized protein n=1 Tax=Nephila pilipes TaxID=299642 RepID=A0A8X6IPK1_NEPPI|nr:hypothetical protein NPIL_536061 [Nephila pilipes]
MVRGAFVLRTSCCKGGSNVPALYGILALRTPLRVTENGLRKFEHFFEDDNPSAGVYYTHLYRKTLRFS